MMVTQILGMDATDIAELKPIMRVRGLWDTQNAMVLVIPVSRRAARAPGPAAPSKNATMAI